MKHTTHWMIVGVYYISRLLGVVAFSYDFESGKVQTKYYITLYCNIMSTLMLGAIPLMFHIEWTPKYTNGPALLYRINAVMCLVTIVAVLMTVVLNWMKRKDIIKIFNDFQHLRRQFLQQYQMSERVERYFKNGIRSKFYWGCISNILMFIVSYDVFGGLFNIQYSIIIAALALLATVLNILFTHYYIAVLNINALLAVINEEVQRILNWSSVLFKRQHLKHIKQAAFVMHCCQLADDLDDLAETQYKIQKLVSRINKLFDLQGACIMLTTYMNNISLMYIFYLLSRHETLYAEHGKWVAVAIPFVSIFYYVDLKIFMDVMLNLEDFIVRTQHLVKNRQPWSPKFDERLEISLKNFSIQIASFPLDTTLMGLFKFCRPLVFASFVSVISNAIVLVQYDYKTT